MSELIRVQDLQKIYRMGDVEVPALRGVDPWLRVTVHNATEIPCRRASTTISKIDIF